MKRGKKGQFYIIAAIIIIGVLVGIFFAGNYAKTKKAYTRVYDLGDELNIETGNVYDHGVYSEENVTELIRSWADTYKNYTRDVVENWILIYGDENKMTAMYFTLEDSGSECIDFGTSPVCVPQEQTVFAEGTLDPEGNKTIEVVFKGIDYDFELEEGQNFFFVISSGQYVAG